MKETEAMGKQRDGINNADQTLTQETLTIHGGTFLLI